MKLLALILLAALAATVRAPIQSAQTALHFQPRQQPAQEEFVPVEGLPADEPLPSAPLLITAYVLVWLVLLGYVWSLWRRMTAVERDLEALQQRLRPKEPL